MTEANDKTQSNIAYWGALNMLHRLESQGKITEQERVGAAAHILKSLGADLIEIRV